MGDRTLARVLRAMKAGEYVGRSDMYRWLRNRHAAIAAVRQKHDPSWVGVAEELAAAGILGRKGKPPTRKTITKIWNRVCRDVASEAVQRLACVPLAKGTGTHAPVTWRPQQVPAQPARQPAQPTQPGPATSDRIGDTMPGVRGPVSDEVVQARKAALRRTLDERSGR